MHSRNNKKIYFFLGEVLKKKTERKLIPQSIKKS